MTDIWLPPPPKINYDKLTPEIILSNQFIRLNTIYKQTDKDGNVYPFLMKPEQWDLYNNKHNLNLILKARQIGFTTLIQLYLLDIALFSPNKSCGVIAHNKDDAEKFFDKKIKFAYDNIPEDFKNRYVPEAAHDRAGQLKFSNGSYITVGTSMRSDTLQYLHISEYGKLCAKFPDRAEEVRSGALNAVGQGNEIFIESTGEGEHGIFYDMAQKAMKKAELGIELTPMDYKFFFYPWYQSPEYRLSGYVEYPPALVKYFKELHDATGVELSTGQKNWYVKKKEEQDDKMFREFPSMPEEAFKSTLEGAVFGHAMHRTRVDGRITRVPWAANIPVNTFWDLGRNDKMAIWFHQRVGFENRFIHYYEDNFHSLQHYAKYLQELPFIYDTHYLPHDAEVTDLTEERNRTRREIFESMVDGNVVVVPRTPSEQEAIEQTRLVFNTCYFDAEKCEQGIRCLDNLRYQKDEKLEEFKPNLMRNWAKHGGDAFMQFGRGYGNTLVDELHSRDDSELSRVQRVRERQRKQHETQDDWRL